MRWCCARVLEFVALVCIGGACSDPLSGQQGELDSNRALWAAQNISAYTYRLQISCFCPTEITSPVMVQVNGDSLVSIVYAGSGEAVDSSFLGNFYTISGLFGVIQHAIDHQAHQLDVTYHPELHYPSSIVIDYDERAVDEELSMTATDLQPLVE